MHTREQSIVPRLRRLALPALAAVALAVLMTWPLAPRLGSAGRTGAPTNSNGWTGSNGDGLFSLWNVAWVARTVVADPVNLFDANIFHPHQKALAYSEANLVSGIVGAPVWWATRNPYATLNFVYLVAFASAYLFAWMLVRHLTEDPATATVAAVFFAFCPYVFAHTSHVQLLWTGGLPLAMLMVHRLADAPTVRRGFGLGLALLFQALACAYYGIFAALMVGYAVVLFAISRSHLRNRDWWKGVAVAAAVSIAGVVPFLFPYIGIQQDEGFRRTLADAARYSANAASYLASSAHAHAWLLRAIADWPRWTDVVFPGFGAVILGLAGAGLAVSRARVGDRARESALLYGVFGLLAFWASFGPRGGLYTALFHIPMFSFLRAPVRLGIVVVLCLAVLAGYALRWLLDRTGTRRTLVAVLLAAAALAELAVIPFPWDRALVAPTPYRVLAKLPRGPLAEFPFYGGRVAWHLHTQYMAFSTTHWMPMLNGYSDHTPTSFRPESLVLDSFPSHDSFRILQKARVRYIGIHWDMFGPRGEEIRLRLNPYLPYLRELAADERMTLYEVVGFP
ncbi:MAG TPA: hypothetical protein VNJ03_00915 [Vicinamibacterales bacterium]|nr:hypothetical protein [Vicinamibacterales bacterium]